MSTPTPPPPDRGLGQPQAYTGPVDRYGRPVGPVAAFPVTPGMPTWLVALLAVLSTISAGFASWAAIQGHGNATKIEHVQAGQAETHKKVDAATAAAAAASQQAEQTHEAVKRIGMARPGPFPPGDPRNESDPPDGRDKHPPVPKEKR